MNYRNYITIESNKRGGKPCVRGLRITVYEVLEYLASEVIEAEILRIPLHFTPLSFDAIALSKSGFLSRAPLYIKE
jgi:uncharacterized protein (DUF433 family)